MTTRPRAHRGETGSATIEYSGVMAAAVVLIVSVLLAGALAAPALGERIRWAICKVTTFGQGECGTPTSAAAHRPVQPCIQSSFSRSLNTGVDILVVTLDSGRQFEVAQMSDGRWRLTQLLGGGVGLETGVGAGITVTVQDRTVGGSALAEAGVALDINRGRVWYTSDPREVERMLSEDGEDALESMLLGSGGPARPVWEAAQNFAGWVTGNGDYEFPDPDETYTEGGVRGTAAAEATNGGDRASASAGFSQVLGSRTVRNGNRTVYFRSTLNAGVALQRLNGLSFEGAQVAGTLELITAATFDTDGVLLDVSVTASAQGEAKGAINALFGGNESAALDNESSGATVYQASLPIRNDIDRSVAIDFLVASGIQQVGGAVLTAAATPFTAGATTRFIDAAAGRGYTTRQRFDTDNTTILGVNAEGKLGLELGASVSVDRATRTSTEAAYWDGTRWVDRTECTPPS